MSAITNPRAFKKKKKSPRQKNEQKRKIEGRHLLIDDVTCWECLRRLPCRFRAREDHFSMCSPPPPRPPPPLPPASPIFHKVHSGTIMRSAKCSSQPNYPAAPRLENKRQLSCRVQGFAITEDKPVFLLKCICQQRRLRGNKKIKK